MDRKFHAEPVAIVGMGCRWPGGVDSPRQMWSFLRDQCCGFRPFDSSSASRCFTASGFHHSDPGRPGTTATEGAFLVDSDPRLFDHTFFGITRREIETLDPSQRKLLEVVYEAFENAGETWGSVAGSNTGVFVGNFSLDHWIIQARDWDYPRPYSTTGASPSILANRISHVFDLRGPSVTVDTACSSSMYAIHLAVTAIRNGECDSAIVAASNWIADPSLQIALDKLGALSPTSRCHTFDASADGYARGEGFAAIYLKRLPVALTSGSPIRAVIRGTAVNANGRTGGITRPSAAGQEAVIRKAYANAGVSFSDTTYVECHGTGTPTGDPIELEAISQVFGSNSDPTTNDPKPLFVGSVKTNMGHAEGASALAAIMKVVLSLEAGEIPPNVGVKILNPSIDFAKAGIEVVRQVMAWPQHRPLRASINSFGFGGSNGHVVIDHASMLSLDRTSPRSNYGLRLNHAVNGHVNGSNGDRTHHEKEVRSRVEQPHHPIVEAPRMMAAANATTRRFVLLPFSAHNESSLQNNISALSQTLNQYPIADVAYTLSAKRSDFPHRSFCVVDTDGSDPTLLSMGGKSNFHTSLSHHQRGSVAFVFTGQAAQWHGMGGQLFEYRVFRTAIEYLDSIIRALPTSPSTWSISSVIKGMCDPDLIQSPDVSQTVCTAVQIGLVDLLASWSLRPVAVVGHSSGEIAAAYASGHTTAADAIVAAYLRGFVVSENKQQGAMLAVALGPDELRDSGYLDGEVSKHGRLQVAAINSPGSVTVSGDVSAIEALATHLAVDGVFHRLLKTGGMAYHSHHMIALGREYEDKLSHAFQYIRQAGLVDERQLYPHVPWGSSVTPNKSPPSSIASSAAYWRANLESPVRFSDAILKLVELEENPINALVEIGPHSALKGPLEQILKSVSKTQIAYAGSTLKRGEDARMSMLQLAGTLYCLSSKINLIAVNSVDNDGAQLNGDVSEDVYDLVHGRTAIDLPPYQYTYGPINYYECRASKDYRLRKVIRHDLLGSKVPGVAKLRPQWRNVLRVKDLPWLSDHRLLPDIVFPAAGYIAMAVEAVLWIHEESPEPRPKPTGYALRNVSIKAALRIPEDDQGVETIFSMELVNAVPSTSSWASFSISSVDAQADTIDNTWTEHCTGSVKIEFGSLPMEAERIDTTSMDVRRIDVRSWYKTFAAIGLGYGPAFRPLASVLADPEKKLATATIALNTTSGTVKGGESRYALHPTALDGAFQLGLIACYGGRVETTTTAFVPVHFSRLYIRDSIKDGSHGAAITSALGEMRGLRGAHINQLQMLGPDGDIMLNVEKLRCISYTGGSEIDNRTKRGSHSAFSAPFTRVVWKPDFRSLNSRSCRALFPPPRENLDRLGAVGKLKALASVIIGDVYSTFIKGDPNSGSTPTPSGNIGHFVAWVKRCAEEANNPEIAKTGQLSAEERRETIGQLYNGIEEIIEARIAKRLHENMADILSGSQTGVDVMVHSDGDDNLLSALYQRGLFMTSAYPQLSRIIDGLAHVNPHLRILEVGAGTGGATRVALRALTGPNGVKRYREYVFTDISPGFLAAAQTSLANFRDIRYSVLDIEADPAAQGYQSLYDVVLASQTLHATASISQMLKHCQKLLRPGGKLVLIENTVENSEITGLLLGTLTGYWHGIADGRINSPFMSLEAWDKALREAGFSGAELVLDDYPEPNNMTTTLVSTLITKGDGQREDKESSKAFRGMEVKILHSLECNPPLLVRLQQKLDGRGISSQPARLDQAQSVVSPNDHVVVLLDGEEDFLLDIRGRHLATFQHLARTAATLVCLTFCGFSDGRNPEGAIIPGLLRTIGTENPASRFISVDISENCDLNTYDSEDLVRCVADKILPTCHKDDNGKEESRSPNINESEYVWQDGCLWVSRVVPDDTLRPYAEISTRNSQARCADGLALQPVNSQGPVRAAFSTPGILSSLYFQPYTELLDSIPSGYIDVKVTAVGINWKDLAVSSGRFDANNLSSEYSGIVTAVGAEAADLFSVGDRVYGMGRGHFGNYTRVPATFAQKLNAQDDLVEVATMPLVYMTAVYAFDYVTRLRRGQKVLIQSASGGLGLAAIQLARAKGAEVFAMVGTIEKAQFLIQEMKMPESHVISILPGDKTSDLDKRLIRITPQGRGFDVILSTARGDVLHASIQALAPLGHLVDVGRTDVQESKALSMELFSKGASFSSFDLSLVLDADPMLGGEIMQAVHSYYRNGSIEPIRPLSATDVSKLDQVLLRFSKGTHVGKLVVTFQDPQTLVRMLPAPSRLGVRFDPEAYYIVVGGFGGLGRSIIRWMCQRGVRKLAVLSRRGIEESCSAAQNLLHTLTTERGINIHSFRCDVSDESQVAQIIRDTSLVFVNASLKGIIHAAVSYLDLSFDKLSVSRWRDSLAAKVQGTKNLHKITLSLQPGQLDFFVMITSLESVYALATQSAYTAANAFQDTFARYRRRLGMPATSISFGFIKEIGDLSQDSITVDMFARNRTLTLSEVEFLERLEAAFLNDGMGDNKSNADKWIGQTEDLLSASNILTCLDPAAMAAKECDEEAEVGNTALLRPTRSAAIPRWYGDPRVSLIMRAFEDAKRNIDTGKSSDAGTKRDGDNGVGESSIRRIRRRFEAAIAAGAAERSTTVEFVANATTTAVAETLFVDVSTVNPTRSVADHGVDSLIAAELRNWFHQALGTNLTMPELLDARISITALAGRIVDAALAKEQDKPEGHNR
ncbi:hypothetical protein F5Y10DRAFT_293418 [Nemania abortiva]|nr:hypothetical protein F5Y10DRAFT_293418 [Nemania abortiva]